MDTYVQAVTDEKREAQSKVVKMLLPGIRRAVLVNGLFWTRGEMVGFHKFFGILASRTGVEPVSPS